MVREHDKPVGQAGWSYDSMGNVSGITALGRTMLYDAENWMVQASVNGSVTNYAYDGDGRRVTKSSPATTYVYDAFGQLAQEYGTPTDSGTSFLAADGLGSTRLITDGNGTVKKRFDYLPFGEELLAGTGGRTAAMGFNVAMGTTVPDLTAVKFTGKERDAETGWDFFGARYMASAQGRFMSADAPFADQHPEDPQSWNMYAYVRNNPLKNTDPNGRDCQNGLVACGNYIVGGVGAVVNAFSSGIINAPNRILDAAISAVAPSSTFRFGDVVPDAFTPMNSEQRQGLDSANAVMVVAPLAEAGATALATAVGTGARVEAGTAAAVQETGTVYKLPAQEGSGKPYIGRTTKSVEERMATRTDGRTGPAEQVDTFNAQDRAHGQYKEQKAINANGGVKNLDNKRNEVNPKRYEELKKKYE